ncbi:MAG: hypothetical protein GY944_05290 [bacterium]|nr:hypothetical protein [bacterium]MCP5040423.1 hypothetical protein [bacterium]
MGVTRRNLLAAGAVAFSGLVLPLRMARAWARSEALDRAIAKSPLVYITPLRSDGKESACHAEVWFVSDGGDLMVVTQPERWRAAAIGKGLDSARLWVGDHGVWKKAEGRFRQAPGCVAKARLEADRAVHARVLEHFGKKYASSWESWGPRFQKGLASGERVLIRYTPSGA